MGNISEASEPGADPRLVWISLGVAAVGTVLAVVWATALGLGPVDDAYISLRYAQNWAQGEGLSFNPGERVEGYTNFLWVVIQTLAIRLGVDPERAMATAGWASLALLVGLQTWMVGKLVLPNRPVLLALAGVVLAVQPILVCWAVSGMETLLFAALILGAFMIVTVGDGLDWARWGGVVLAIAGLCRPEAVALVPAAMAVILLRIADRRRGLRQALRMALWFAVPYGVYFLARWGYFGYLLPNTFYAKLDYGGVEIWRRGWLYVWDFLRAAPLVTMLACLGAVLGFRKQLWVRAWSLVVVSQLFIVAYEGGDHFAMFRFLVGTLPFLAALALSVATWRPAGGRLSKGVETAVVLITILAFGLASQRLGRQEKRYERPGVRQLARFKIEGEMARQWGTMGRWLRENASTEASLATIAVGAIGYHSQRRILDPLGLTDPQIAHRETALGTGYIGHEKFDIDWVFRSQPDYLLLANLLTNAPIPEASLPRWAWGTFNKRLLDDPRLHRLYRYEPVEILPGRWMNLHRIRD